MITVVYRVVAKEGKEQDFKNMALKCNECANESKDCLYYTFFQSLTNPAEFLVYYRFSSKEAQDTHIQNLHKKIGPAKEARDLPTDFLDLLKEEELILFKDDNIKPSQ